MIFGSQRKDNVGTFSVIVKVREGLFTAVMNSPECWRWIFLFCSSSQWRCPCSAPALAVIAPVPWVASSYLKQLNYWLSLCDRGGVKSLGTLSWGQMQTRPKQSLIPPHVLTGSTTYHSITHWIPSCLGCQFASHYSLSRDFRFLITPDESNLQFKECQIWPCTLQVSFYRKKRSIVLNSFKQPHWLLSYAPECMPVLSTEQREELRLRRQPAENWGATTTSQQSLGRGWGRWRWWPRQ